MTCSYRHQWHSFSTRHGPASILDTSVYKTRILSVAVDTVNNMDGVREDTDDRSNNTYDRSECFLQMNIDATLSINNYINIYHEIVGTHGVCGGGHIDSIFYVIWLPSKRQNTNMSWHEANDKCVETGGHLPHVLSETDMSLLEHLILGSRFNSTVWYPFVTPARLMERTHIYLGSKFNQV